MIPSDLLQKFKEIYKEEFGKDLNDAEVLDLAQRLVNLYQLVFKANGKE